MDLHRWHYILGAMIQTTPLRPAAEVRMQLPDIVLLREN